MRDVSQRDKLVDISDTGVGVAAVVEEVWDAVELDEQLLVDLKGVVRTHLASVDSGLDVLTGHAFAAHHAHDGTLRYVGQSKNTVAGVRCFDA